MLRQDPDVILIGELRDLETISVALTAAETGHLVFATLHTQDAAQTIDRIIDVFPPHQQGQVRAQLAATLQGVVCQTLVKHAERRGPRRRDRGHDDDAGRRQPHPRGQDLPDPLGDAGRARARHAHDGPAPRRPGQRGQITHEAALEKVHDVEDFKRLVHRAETVRRGRRLGGIDFGDAFSSSSTDGQRHASDHDVRLHGPGRHGQARQGQARGAPSEGAVAARLRTMGISPVAIARVGRRHRAEQGDLARRLRRSVKLKDLAVMSRQMATMIASGLSLLRTLTILVRADREQEARDDAGRGAQRRRVGADRSPTRSRKHPVIFPPLMINLDPRRRDRRIPRRVARARSPTDFEKEVKLRATIKSAMTYPVVVLVMAVVAVVGMLIFIVPVFEKMFDDLGGELPLPTQMLVVLSKNMVWLAPVLIVVDRSRFAVWWRKNKNTERVRSVVDPLKLKLPVFGALLTQDRRRAVHPQLRDHDRRGRADPAGRSPSSARPRATG